MDYVLKTDALCKTYKGYPALNEFSMNFLPGGQSFQIAQMSSKHPDLLILYSGILIIITTGAGIFIFRQKDLN